jgi:hypothetical protein
MNGFMPYTSSFIGATGQYPIYDYINSNITDTSNYVLITSNILNSNIYFNSNVLNSNMYFNSNILQTQVTKTSNLIYKDDNLNTIVKLTAQNPQYPLIGQPKEIRFQNVNGDYITKINQTGELFVYHPLSPIPVGYDAGWWSVENKLSSIIQEEIGLRFDVVQLQATTGTAAITDAGGAAAAVATATGGVIAAGTATAAAGTAIAGGDYGTVALGAAGGALFSVLGYLSYQAQVESNLSSNGFSNQASNVHSNISKANILITDNISNICIAKGFINCNITKQQYIPSLRTNDINIQGNSISNIYISSNVLNGYLNANLITSSNYTSNTSNVLNGYLNTNLITSSNYTSNTSNTLYFNLISNSNNNYIYTSNQQRKFSIIIPSSNYWYDGINSLYCYDLNIEKYASSLNAGGGFKSRAYRIETLVSTADWTTSNNLLVNNEFINKPEPLTIYTNNLSNYFGLKTPNDNYANGIIMGKNQNTNIGYWNLISSNTNSYNYIRYMAKAGFDLNVIIENLLI